MTEPRGLPSRIARVSEVMTNAMKNPVVSLWRSVVAPRAPKAVCEPPPPNAPARSAADWRCDPMFSRSGVLDGDLLYVKPLEDVQEAAGRLVVCDVGGEAFAKELELRGDRVRL